MAIQGISPAAQKTVVSAYEFPKEVKKDSTLQKTRFKPSPELRADDQTICRVSRRGFLLLAMVLSVAALAAIGSSLPQQLTVQKSPMTAEEAYQSFRPMPKSIWEGSKTDSRPMESDFSPNSLPLTAEETHQYFRPMPKSNWEEPKADTQHTKLNPSLIDLPSPKKERRPPPFFEHLTAEDRARIDEATWEAYSPFVYMLAGATFVLINKLCIDRLDLNARRGAFYRAY